MPGVAWSNLPGCDIPYAALPDSGDGCCGLCGAHQMDAGKRRLVDYLPPVNLTKIALNSGQFFLCESLEGDTTP